MERCKISAKSLARADEPAAAQVMRWFKGPDPRKSKQISTIKSWKKNMVWKLSIGLLKHIAAFYHDPGSLTLALHAVPVQLH